ncbi:SOS response-associated peptidase [Pseudomonas sp. P66]|jgi:putative SOS response-associated peptidase YedK|uniref:Abasic site processing protein n=1 Tax=Pseudomonas arcuscaelestis TaxID=2710591 RepID=A0ABS2BYF8_9PSED|nr:SOS response-associated peptidase [Pseudomonas arcuscaelestis]MBM5458652.1 SOS response-associated peptidase [Pseudomonas arcuscaelestis]
MCSHYEAPSHQRLLDGFGVAPQLSFKEDLWPTYHGPFLRLPGDEEADNHQSTFEALTGQFGLLPFWAKDQTLGRRTYNARSETASSKPSFRDAWKKGRHCIIPATAIYEPDWRTGKAVPTRITRSDGGIMAIAGLWDEWRSPDGELIHSFAMLTVNADEHSLMSQYHKPQDEKRSVVILPNGLITDWLRAGADKSMDFMRLYPADRLSAEARPA